MIRQVGKGWPEPELIFSVVTDQEEIAQALAVSKQFQCNVQWLQAHQAELYAQPKGKFFAVAGQQVFWADTAEEAWLWPEPPTRMIGGSWCDLLG